VLYDPEAHEALVDEPWDAGRTRAAISRIVADADEAFDPHGLWPANEWDVWKSRPPLSGIYVGAAGVIWALDALRRRGFAETRLDLGAAARRALEKYRELPDDPDPPHGHASLWIGLSGILLVAWRLEPSPDLADELLGHVRGNAENDVNELMWGSPGTMLAARAMHDVTGEDRWLEAWRESADELVRRWEPDGLWTQRLYGQVRRHIGPAHGFAGNVLALAQGDALTPELVERARDAAARFAVLEDGLANWRPHDGMWLVDRAGETRLQWCHGAPGVVTSVPGFLEEELLLAGAELTWQAGPLRKGPGLCHGTAGNGYALLKAFRHTGDERWLERARRFAVHALRQVEAEPGRYSLWTGGPGVALYAADCLDGLADVPTIDVW
jgi:lantibiotic modifying enzyme